MCPFYGVQCVYFAAAVSRIVANHCHAVSRIVANHCHALCRIVVRYLDQ